jgi:hypothetical protein
VKIASREFRDVWTALHKYGVLLLSDKCLPNAVSLLAGEPVNGSWWAHPKGQKIFHGINHLIDAPDVLAAKLLSRKVTLIDRRLWRDFLSIASAGESWQIRGLSPAQKFLLKTVEDKGQVRSDEIKWPNRFHSTKVGEAVRELERRLLIHAEEFHSQRGAHAKLLEQWPHWAERMGFKEALGPSAESKRLIEDLVAELNHEYGGKARLPWPTASH